MRGTRRRMTVRAVSVLLVGALLLTLAGGTALAVSRQCTSTPTNRDCSGTQGDDKLVGNEVPERFYGLGGDDLLKGVGGGDVFYAGGGDDEVFGGNGADIVHSGSGNDALRGGEKDDMYVFERSVGRDTVIDGRRRDGLASTGNEVEIGDKVVGGATVNLNSSPTAPEVRSPGSTGTMNWSNDVIDVVTNDSPGQDVIRGNDAANQVTLDPNSAADTIYGLGGDDSIDARDGEPNDTVNCGENADGSPDNDTVSHDPGDTLLNCEVQQAT